MTDIHSADVVAPWSPPSQQMSLQIVDLCRRGGDDEVTSLRIPLRHEGGGSSYTVVLRVFVCHASEDKPQVRELCRRLREDGFEPWLDEEQLLPGQDWELEISGAVRASDVVIVCLSVNSVSKAGYVQKELRLVLDAAEYQPEGRIFVVPARLQECLLPMRLNRWESADLFAEDGYQRLKLALTARTESRDTVSLLPPRRSETQLLRPRQRRRWSIAVTAVLLTIAGVTALYRTTRLTSPQIPPASAPAGPHATNSPTKLAGMALIPGGRFLMGRNQDYDQSASPAHEVALPTFYLDITPVTNALFTDFLKSSNRVSQSVAISPGEDQSPVTRVTWDEADAYCLAQGKRLPSEAEWEFAARGTDGRLYPWGENFDAGVVNTRESRIGHPEPVGIRPRNRSPYGVADLTGNVWQWCSDDYRPYPGGTAAFAIPPGAKAIRGGSYQSDRLHATAVTRNLDLPSTRSPAIGFRCAKMSP